MYARIALTPESIKNRVVFGRAEIFQRKATLIPGSSRGKKLGRAQQTADLIGTDLWFHCDFPDLSFR
jgi:hypothetical protein